MGPAGASDIEAASVASKNQFSKGRPIMTIRTRVALAAFAQDKMSKDDAMKKDTMSKDGMKKDGMKKDTMSKDTMSKDGMKKDDGMMKKN
jgi:pentapeptide MXKDX repeat protein